jgi:hypothetical protein
MVAVNLDTKRQHQLEQLASAEGKPAAELARKVIEDYLDQSALREISDEEWAEGCTALSPEVFPNENWDEEDDA